MNPCLSLAIARLNNIGPENFAIWATESPLPGGYSHRNCLWPVELTQKWLIWQKMFSVSGETHIPVSHYQTVPEDPILEENYSAGKLMQDMGISLWKWLFEGDTRNSLSQSWGIAIGKERPLRLRLEIRDPYLIPLPWEIMQPEAGKQSIALSQQILFSRTTTAVDPLQVKDSPQQSLKILLVLGEKSTETDSSLLNLEEDARILSQIIKQGSASAINPQQSSQAIPAQVDILIQPTVPQLTAQLDRDDYNIFFYAGHGEKTAHGGRLLLGPQTVLDGIELAQVLTRNRVMLAVFNACWGAQPDQEAGVMIERSSLTEVLIHHGVPAVLGMRDAIADDEALTFIEFFSRALTEGRAIDEAVAIARQQLLTIYKYIQPAWTLPVLYMHPNFHGILIKPLETTELPGLQPAYLKTIDQSQRRQTWRIFGSIRIGRVSPGSQGEINQVVIPEPWVSSDHAVIYYQKDFQNDSESGYFLKDSSRYGTYIYRLGKWEMVHHREVPLHNGNQIKFGSFEKGRTLEFCHEEVKS